MDFDFRQEALNLVLENNYHVIVEVGVWRGELSRLFYKVANTLLLVDPWDARQNCFVHNRSLYSCTMGEPFRVQTELDQIYNDVRMEFPNAVVLRMSSEEAASILPNQSIDFVFIDSVHTYEHCRRDIKVWTPKIRSGGMLAGDDYYPPHKAVSRAVDEIPGSRTLDRVWMVSL